MRKALLITYCIILVASLLALAFAAIRLADGIGTDLDRVVLPLSAVCIIAGLFGIKLTY